ncbi:MAG: four helix bundle protein [Desulfobacteraceae bacterium]|nr:MAG: four helix bundle protein [Desulfobacteraceae bacterium]
MASYRDLAVWEKAMDLVVDCYKLSKKFPKSEIFGLCNQLQRAAVSVPANIAEGRERQSPGAFAQYLSISYGSLAELETHLQIAQRLGYFMENELDRFLQKTSEVGKMINGLRKAVISRQKKADN